MQVFVFYMVLNWFSKKTHPKVVVLGIIHKKFNLQIVGHDSCFLSPLAVDGCHSPQEFCWNRKLLLIVLSQ